MLPAFVKNIIKIMSRSHVITVLLKRVVSHLALYIDNNTE